MVETSIASRRAFLGLVASAPVIGALATEFKLAAPQDRMANQPFPLRRSREGRQLSRIRYRNAESFFATVEEGLLTSETDQLYQTGITLQLALSSHLLDVGFSDAWCASNIGLYVNKSLEHANATGLGLGCVELKSLAEFLSPYGRWRNAGPSATDACPFSHDRICSHTRDLLERVHEVAGHSRPHRRIKRDG